MKQYLELMQSADEGTQKNDRTGNRHAFIFWPSMQFNRRKLLLGDDETLPFTFTIHELLWFLRAIPISLPARK